MALPTSERAAVTAAMADVAKNGKKAARHLRGEIFEVRAEGVDVIYRLLFATEGRYSQVLLGLAFFTKKTRRTPPAQTSWRSSVWPTGARVVRPDRLDSYNF